jgi:hypothetical protein
VATEERSAAADVDDRLAWRNWPLLEDEPGGVQEGDLIMLPHLPALGQWSVVRVTGPYRYEPDPNLQNYGHIRPVRIELAGLEGDDGMPELRRVRRYRGRMRRLTSEAEADLRRMVGTHG